MGLYTGGNASALAGLSIGRGASGTKGGWCCRSTSSAAGRFWGGSALAAVGAAVAAAGNAMGGVSGEEALAHPSCRASD